MVAKSEVLHFSILLIGFFLFAWGFQKFGLWNSYWSVGLTPPFLEDFWWRQLAVIFGSIISILELYGFLLRTIPIEECYNG